MNVARRSINPSCRVRCSRFDVAESMTLMGGMRWSGRASTYAPSLLATLSPASRGCRKTSVLAASRCRLKVRYLKRQWLRLARSGGSSRRRVRGHHTRRSRGVPRKDRDESIVSPICTTRRRPLSVHDRFRQTAPGAEEDIKMRRRSLRVPLPPCLTGTVRGYSLGRRWMVIPVRYIEWTDVDSWPLAPGASAPGLVLPATAFQSR